MDTINTTTLRKYSYGVPGPAIWTTHILVGLLLIYIGYMTLNEMQIHQGFSILLLILGSVIILYHSHLMYLNYTS